jgi:serine/threonine protein kinase
MFQQHDDLQTVISGYTLVDFIGGGQFGKVYKAIKKDSQTIYAVKVVRKFIPNIDAQRRAKLRLLLETEIRAMQLCNSDNVVRIVERLETPSKIYIVMEYCDGPDL